MVPLFVDLLLFALGRVPEAILLAMWSCILTPPVDFNIPVVLRCGVVFVLVDMITQIVLLPVDDPLFLRR